MPELMSTPTRSIVTGNQPVSGDKAKIFDYGNAVPIAADTKPAPSMSTPCDLKGEARS